MMRASCAVLLAVLLPGTPALAQTPARPEGAPVRLVIDARHRMTVGGVRTTPRTLVAALDRMTGEDHARTVVIQAAPSVRYGEVNDVMSRLDVAGYRSVSLLSP